MNIVHLSSGDSVILKSRTKHRLVCCSCNYVHDFSFYNSGLFIGLTMWANDKATAKERAKTKRKGAKHG